MKRRSHAKPAASRINVTPMIDVVMVLIVFYLIVGRLASDQRADLSLPESRTGLEEDLDGAIVVDVRRPDESDPAPRYSLAGAPISAAALEDLLRSELQADPGRAIRIRADRSLTYAAVQPAIEAARRAGAHTVRLATERAAR